MVIVAGTYGQFCNQLLRLGHHIAHGLDHGYEVNCADFAYRHLFANLTQHPLVSDRAVVPGWLGRWATRAVGRWALRLWAAGRGCLVLDGPLHLPTNDTRFMGWAVRRTVIATHWDFRDFGAFNRHHATIKHLFALPPAVEKQAGELLRQARQRGNVVVGVHLRRGDYAHWEGGRYCYSDAVYARLMARVAGFFPGRSVVFLLCSNVPIDAAAFARFRVLISTHDATVDLSVLSRCDWLMGPPSTFSHWASYVGQVPLYHIQIADNEFTINDFSISQG